MLQVTDKALSAMSILSIDVTPEHIELDHYDVLIELELGFVVYNTLTQCIFFTYKDFYGNVKSPDFVYDLLYAKALAYNRPERLRGQTFVIQPDTYTRVRDDLLTSLVSCSLRYYDKTAGLPVALKACASLFPVVNLLEEQPLEIKEVVKSDVITVFPRDTH